MSEPLQNRTQEMAVRHSEEHGGAPLFCYGCRWAGVVKTTGLGRPVPDKPRSNDLRCPSCGEVATLLLRSVDRRHMSDPELRRYSRRNNPLMNTLLTIVSLAEDLRENPQLADVTGIQSAYDKAMRGTGLKMAQALLEVRPWLEVLDGLLAAASAPGRSSSAEDSRAEVQRIQALIKAIDDGDDT